MSDAAPVDLQRLRELAPGEPADLRSFGDMFLDALDDHLTDLGRALAAGETPIAEQVAHTAAGVAGMCGAGTLAGLLEQVETEARQGNLALARDRCTTIGAERDRVRAFLDQQLT